MKRFTSTLLAAASFTLAGCSAVTPTPESVGAEACDAFAYYLGEAEGVKTMDRKTTAQQVNYELTKHEGVVADVLLTEGADILTRSIDAPATQWVLAADTFVVRCTDSGWAPNA